MGIPLPGGGGGAPLSSAHAHSEFLGTVNFGPRDGGNAWVVLAIVGVVVVLGLLIWKGK